MTGWMDLVPDPTEVAGSELPKSRITRRRILDAAVAILAEQGHAGFSTIAVSQRARITRPAMLYPFGSRDQLLVATAQHVMRCRAETFEEMLRELVERLPMEGQRAMWHAFENLASFGTVEYAAFSELAIMARADAGFAESLATATAAFERARLALTRQYLAHEPALFRKLDVLNTLADGLMVPMRMVENRQARATAVRRFLAFLAISPEGEMLFDAADRAGMLRPRPEEMEAAIGG